MSAHVFVIHRSQYDGCFLGRVSCASLVAASPGQRTASGVFQALHKNKLTNVVTAASKNRLGGKDSCMINLSAAIYLWQAIHLEKLS